MSYQLKYISNQARAEIELPYSKSVANRLLIAQALAIDSIEIKNLSDSEDTHILLDALNSSEKEINVGMAGTAFRFLTAYFSMQEGERILTGDNRMKDRPIGILVDQLRRLGADISYLEKEGYPPLKIIGKQLETKELIIDASVSSQYITALLLIAPQIKGGLRIELIGELVSLPYIDLTIALQQKLGAKVRRSKQWVSVEEGNYACKGAISVERDWSAAAFFYQLVALGKIELELIGLYENSLQGDKACVKIFSELGVETVFHELGATLKPKAIVNVNEIELDLTDTPDLIPSVAVTVSQLIDKTTIKGTKTLYIKESNRVEALKTELRKIAVEIEELDQNSIQVQKADFIPKIDGTIDFLSYNDHRIAMCLAPLALLNNGITIENPDVVGKSFVTYWEELAKIGVNSQVY